MSARQPGQHAGDRWLARLILCGLLLSLSGGPATAQWAIGSGGDRAAVAPLHRYAFLVFANPAPGREAEFNDWYQNIHLGDLLQLDGWSGAQRFRVASGGRRPQDSLLSGLNYLVIWDQDGVDANLPATRMKSAIAGGKSRSTTSIGQSLSGTFEAVGKRIVRPDGMRSALPLQSDDRAVRPAQYLVLETHAASAAPQPEHLVEARIRDTLAAAGWMAAQRFRFVSSARPGLPDQLIMWEVEATSVAAAAAARAESLARARGASGEPASSESDWELSFWEPISPYVTRQMLVH